MSIHLLGTVKNLQILGANPEYLYGEQISCVAITFAAQIIPRENEFGLAENHEVGFKNAYTHLIAFRESMFS